MYPVAILKDVNGKTFIVDGVRWTPCSTDTTLDQAKDIHRKLYASDYEKKVDLTKRFAEDFKVIPMKSLSRKNAGKSVFYHVRVYESGRVECDCPGYHYRRKCRHVEEVRNLGTALNYLNNGRKP